MLERELKNSNCRHCFFGGLSDGGYKRQLDPISFDLDQRQRITLLEGLDCAATFRDLRNKFKTFQLEDLFRSSQFEKPDPAPTASAAPNGYSAYATVAGAGAGAGTHMDGLHTVSPRPQDATRIPQSQPRGPVSDPRQAPSLEFQVLRNRRNQRIDSILDVDPDIVERVKKRKLCNKHHLLGSCQLGQNCHMEHAVSLSAIELKHLQYVARMSKCLSELDCKERYCIFGHACPWISCQRPSCRFPPHMHNVGRTQCSA